MSMVVIPGAGHFQFPPVPINNGTTGPSTSNSSAAASAARVAMIISAPKAGTLDKFEWMCNTYTATNTVRHSFQTVDATTGFPDGTVDEYRTHNPTTATWEDPGVMTSDGTGVTGTKRTVSRGERIACVVDFSAYTSGSVTVRTLTVANPLLYSNYVATYNGVTWTAASAVMPIVVLKYDDGTYSIMFDNVLAIKQVNTQNINTGTNPDEVGIKFTVPFNCVVAGASAWLDADGDVELVLYDAANTELGVGSIDKDVRGAAAGGMHRVTFPSGDVTLTRDVTYRLVARPTSGTSVAVYDTEWHSTGLMVASPGGSGVAMTVRENAGSWNDANTTRQPHLSLLISQIDNGVGAASQFSGTVINRSVN